ncbi:MAG: hypothetical protein ACOZDY_09385 [Pseudomonadota bacterium]
MSAIRSATAALVDAYRRQDTTPGEGSPPSLLAEALEQVFAVFDQLDRQHGKAAPLPCEDPSRLGEHALSCLSDLELWADRLGQRQALPQLGELAVEAAEWTARHGGVVRVLEPVVNAFAAQANVLSEPDQLARLCERMSRVIDAVDPALRADAALTGTFPPWRVLLFNHAIVATRTQDPDRMERAFNLLGALLPQDCPAFFDEALQQSEKPVYSDAVRDVVRRHHGRWNRRH